MTIPEAINEQQSYLTKLNIDIPPKVRQSMKLGIEALKRQQEHRDHDPNLTYHPLPGETKE